MENLNTSICRICLGCDNLSCIFSKRDDVQICDMVMLCASVQIYENDSLPNKICTSCVDKAETAYNFKITCEATHAKLTSYYKPEESFVEQEHSDKALPIDESNQKIYDECIEQIKKASSPVGRHINKKNKQQPRKLCQDIITFDDEELYEETVITEDTNIKTSEKHICEYCKKEFQFRSHLARHLNSHTNAKNFSCKYCGDIFRNGYNLSVHSRKHVGGFPLKCKVCLMGFVSPSVLKRHMISHTKELPFQCEYCGNKFAHKSSLKLHENMHISKPSYSCHICYKVFSYKNTLSEHMKGHLGIKNFKCENCGSAFTRNTLLNRHLKSCMRKTVCTVCSKSFNTATLLRAHLKTHKRYKCNLCDAEFLNKGVFVRHSKTHVITEIELNCHE